ncbi:MAG TPA: UDP-N-acetylglucosamine 2-epimerase (non-hydrolyzing) [Devosia sp.]|jgi:UDP-GlcNAc3NAcA epimerase|uniref:non-hydrolyzing UDP-N-acetylglucosamine 2-epimerase n=1 Tax=Devosia sp. TaxID=1871048 RepID=UPI002F92F42E
MKIVTVVGARPQFVKAAVVSRAIANTSDLEEILVHTGQHFDANMSDIFFDELSLAPPAHNLGIGGGSHAQNTGRAMESIEAVLMSEKPDWVLVYGDTDSTLAGALAAAKCHIKVAHVEAGLRSFNRRMPEEINRVMTDHLSTVLFAPSDTAVRNLQREGIAGDKVRMIGDVMVDAVHTFTAVAKTRSNVLDRLGLGRNGYVLATLHRQENTDDSRRLGSILAGLARSDLPIVLPLHPRTRKRIEQLGWALPDSVRITDPVGYLDMMMLEANARAIATDSGGVQKEAYLHGVPCITLRDETEWTELVTSGANTLVGADTDRIAAALSSVLFSNIDRTIYGEGQSARAIAAFFSQEPNIA